MTTFDTSRIMELARTLESGSLEDKLAMLDELDASEPVTSGVLMRALGDPDRDVRYRALVKMADAGIRPIDIVLEQVLNDDDPEIRALAAELRDRPDATNPLEQLVPMVERLADQLGPLGGMLRSMVESLRGIGEQDERGQLLTVTRLDDSNPAATVVVQQALQSAHISVRIAALKKVLELEHGRCPESLMAQFVVDPSEELRVAADAVVRAGKVGTVDPDTLRSSVMQTMIQSLMGSGLSSLLGGAGGGGLDLSALFGGAGGGGLDLSALLGGGGGLDLSALLGGTAGAGPTASPSRRAHQPAGHLYVVGDVRVRDRLLKSLTRLDEEERAPEVVQLDGDNGHGRWALTPVQHEPALAPGWVESLAESGFEVDDALIGQAEQARFLSEQVWGAAFADHRADPALTLVFHDGILSRGEWTGAVSGAYRADGATQEATADGPLALLCAFLADPTDDKLHELPGAVVISESG